MHDSDRSSAFMFDISRKVEAETVFVAQCWIALMEVISSRKNSMLRSSCAMLLMALPKHLSKDSAAFCCLAFLPLQLLTWLGDA